MRRMLDPTKVGGIPSTIEFDKDGNRKVDKNLGVGGKLTLKSLVSASNPDGDITKELGGKQRHRYSVYIGDIYYVAYTEKDYNFNIGGYAYLYDFLSNKEYYELRKYKNYPACGCYAKGTDKRVVSSILLSDLTTWYVLGYNLGKQEANSQIKIDIPETIKVMKSY